MNDGKICISICAATAAELFEKIARAEDPADVIEIRFDCLRPDEVDAALAGLPKISKLYLITYRPSEQGGRRVLSMAHRILFWKNAVRALEGHVFLADHETGLDFPFGFDRGRIIRSLHFYGRSPADLRGSYFELAELTGGTVKIAADCPDITDTIKVWKLLETAKNSGGRVIPIAMGEAGKWTRILGPAYGAEMTYAALEAGGETAPGQISASDLIDTFRVRCLDRGTLVHGIVAGNTTYSVSPWMHNAAFKAARLNRVFVPLQVSDLDAFVKRMVLKGSREIELRFAGLSVTNPHKQAIIPYLDELDPSARAIGAVNTVKIDGDRLIGYNTDAPGFIAPLKAVIGDLRDVRVAVAGAGGAARACVYALKRAGAHVTVFARDPEKARSLGEDFHVPVEIIDRDVKSFDRDILVNTTPLGTSGETADITVATAEKLSGMRLVYDLVYNPAETRLIREAKQAGVPAVGGLEMLIAQGAEQFEIWTGLRAPVQEMKEAVLRKLG